MLSITHSMQETLALGEALGRRLRSGDVVLLSGEMGSGKSVLARGIARGLGVQGPMPSPSFPLMLVYEGRDFPVYHMDWYRLEDADALHAVGLEEFLGGEGVAIVEWPERAMEAVLPRNLLITFRPGENDNERQLTFTAEGGFPPSVWENLGGLSGSTETGGPHDSVTD